MNSLLLAYNNNNLLKVTYPTMTEREILMKTNRTAWDQVNAIAQLSDLKEAHYRNTLALSALIEILVEKGVLSPDDFHRKAAGMEQEDDSIAEHVRQTSSTVSHSVERS
jgi:hypothetical protein